VQNNNHNAIDSAPSYSINRIKRAFNLYDFASPLFAPSLPINSLTEQNKKKKPCVGDRFIPTRSLDSEEEALKYNWPTKRDFNQLSDHNKLTTCSIFNTTPEWIQTRKILSFSNAINHQKPLPQMHTDILFAQGTQQPNTRISPKKFSIDMFRVLDAPSVLPDFYSHIFTWADTDLISIALNTTGQNGQIYSMNLKDGSIGSTAVVPQKQAYSTAALGPSEIISGWSDGRVRTNALDSHALEAPYSRSIHISAYKVNALVTTNATTVFCGTEHGELSCLDLRTPNTTTTTIQVNETVPDRIAGLAYNSHYYVASGTNNNVVKLWDIRKLTTGAVSTYTDHTAAIKGLAFHPDSGDYLVTGGGTACHKIYLWHVPSGRKIYMVDALTQVTGVHWFKHDPKYLLTSHGFGDCSVKLWRVTNEKLILQYQQQVSEKQGDRTLCLAGSPTTNEFAVVTESETLRFFKPYGINTKEKQPIRARSILPPMLGDQTIPRL